MTVRTYPLDNDKNKNAVYDTVLRKFNDLTLLLVTAVSFVNGKGKREANMQYYVIHV